MQNATYYIADVYGSDAYSSGAYQEVQGTSQNTGQPATGGPLANTGYDIIIPGALGLAIIGASLFMLAKKFRFKKS